MDLRTSKTDQKVRDLKLKFKSEVPSPHESQGKCLIRFQNCTPYKVVPYWINFNGCPVRYSDLSYGVSLNVDTFVSQLWFFRASINTQDPAIDPLDRDNHKTTIKTIMAVPEEALDAECNAVLSHSIQITDSRDLSSITEEIFASVYVCGLCKYILRKFSRLPKTIPCSHYNAQAKYCCSDLSDKAEMDFNLPGAFVYSCSELTHDKKVHPVDRRTIFLVESFHSLKEHCYRSLGEDTFDEASKKLPPTIRHEYVTFVSTVEYLESKLTSR